MSLNSGLPLACFLVRSKGSHPLPSLQLNFLASTNENLPILGKPLTDMRQLHSLMPVFLLHVTSGLTSFSSLRLY